MAGCGNEQGFLLKEDGEDRQTLGRAVLVESRKDMEKNGFPVSPRCYKVMEMRGALEQPGELHGVGWAAAHVLTAMRKAHRACA